MATWAPTDEAREQWWNDGSGEVTAGTVAPKGAPQVAVKNSKRTAKPRSAAFAPDNFLEGVLQRYNQSNVNLNDLLDFGQP